MSTAQKHVVKKLPPDSHSQYEYRGVKVRRDDNTTSFNRWSCFAMGFTIRCSSLASMKREIDTALERQQVQKALGEERARAELVLEQQRQTAAQRFASALSFHPTPWHVEPTTESYGTSFSVYPNPTVVEGSRMPVASDIAQELVANTMALAPEMLDLLRQTKHVLEQNRWDRADRITGGPLLAGLVQNLIDRAEGAV